MKKFIYYTFIILVLLACKNESTSTVNSIEDNDIVVGEKKLPQKKVVSALTDATLGNNMPSKLKTEDPKENQNNKDERGNSKINQEKVTPTNKEVIKGKTDKLLDLYQKSRFVRLDCCKDLKDHTCCCNQVFDDYLTLTSSTERGTIKQSDPIFNQICKEKFPWFQSKIDSLNKIALAESDEDW